MALYHFAFGMTLSISMGFRRRCFLRDSFYLFGLVACWLLPTSAPAESLGSLRAITEFRKGESTDSHEFDLNVHLVFATKHHEFAVMQDESTGMYFPVTKAQREQLVELNPGALLRIQGSVRNDKRANPEALAISDIQVIDPDYLLPGLKGKLGPNQWGTPLSRLAVARGRAMETVQFPNRTLFYLAHETAPFTATCFSPIHPKRIATILGKQVKARGSVRNWGLSRSARVVHDLMLMRPQQLQILAPEIDEQTGIENKSDPESLLNNRSRMEIEGTVAYTNHATAVTVISGDERYWVRTRFADQLNVGKTVTVRGLTCWNHRKDANVMENLHTTTGPLTNLSEPVETNPAKLLTQHKIPARVKLTGTVQRETHQEAGYRISLTDGPFRFTAVLGQVHPYDHSSRSRLQPGSVVEVVGIPIRHHDRQLLPGQEPNAETSPSFRALEILTPSLADIRVVSQPVTLRGNQLRTAVTISTLTFGIAVALIYLLWRQVSSRKSQLTEISSQLDTAFEAMQEAVLIIDNQDRVVRVNKCFHAMFGLAPQPREFFGEYLNLIASDFSETNEFENFWAATKRNRNLVDNLEFHRVHDERIFQVFSSPIRSQAAQSLGRLWMFKDVTANRRLQADLLQSQKLDAVGKLSGGIAHDFNNFLTVIQSSITTIRRDREHPDRYLDVANHAVERATDLTQQLLGFARRSTLQRQVVDLNEVVSDLSSMLRSLVHAPIRFDVVLCPQDVLALVDRARVEQAIINLCLNAKDAVCPRGGQIVIAVSTHSDTEHDQIARIRVTDNGGGIPPHVQKQIFEPFFTTKDVGEGTGLGLAVAQGVIEQHGGNLRCTSSTSTGTVFEIDLPMADEDATELKGSPPSKSLRIENQDVWRGQPSKKMKLLLVDDDELVRASGAALLEQLSHEVTVAENGIMALRELALSDDYDVVILDVMMPEMSGIETFLEIRSEWPTQRVVFCTAFAKQDVGLEQLDETIRPPLLMKPFRIEDLQRVLNRLTQTELHC